MSRGLIEAPGEHRCWARGGELFSAVMSRGLIEATWLDCVNRLEPEFSAVMSRGLIEATWSGEFDVPVRLFSAVMSRGLIEAGRWTG